jgi:DNA-binding CsgD family transcriptional regulator/DNA-binding beta-propeller fold protein YncE
MGREGVRQGSLSRRELEVAALVAEGLTNKAIAQRMFISERTVDGHLEHIREKLGVSSRAQVSAWFVAQSRDDRHGAVAPPIPRRRIRRTNILLPVVALAVLALVIGVTLFERIGLEPPAGPAVTKFTSVNPGDRLSWPWSVAVGGDGLVYIADHDNSRIRQVDPKAGSILNFAGTDAFGDFIDGSDKLETFLGGVSGIAISPDGSKYFANNVFVGRIDLDSTVHFVAGARRPADRRPPVRFPTGLAFAPDGTLYIADMADNQVWKRTPDGTLSLFAGNGQMGFSGDGGAATEAELDLPRALAIEPDGDVLIADTDNNRIREVLHGSGVIVTLAGTGTYYGFSGDGGPATQAKLSLPWGVAAGRDGTIYIADAGNDRIRSINAKGVITTLVHGDLNAPSGLALSVSGDLFVVDLGDPWLRVVHLARGTSSS